MPKETITADSTQLAMFCDCPQMWVLRHRELLLPNMVPESSEAAMQGVYGHHLLEVFYRSVAAGESRQMAIERSFTTPVPPRSDEPDKPFVLDPILQFKVKERVRLYIMSHTLGTTEFEVDKPEQVEVGFSHLLYEDCDSMYILEGRLDLVNVRLSGLECIADHKFQLRRHDLYKKSIQFRNYAMVARAKMLLINYIRLAQKVDADTFKRDVSLFTQDEHNWWQDQVITMFHKMRAALHGEPPKNWGSCSGKFNEPCFYTQLCGERNNEVRAAMKQQLYKIVPEWRPW